MAQVSIHIKNIAEIKKAFNKAPILMRRNLNTAIQKSVILVEGKSKAFTPVDTGRLRSSHRTLFKDLYGEVGTNTTYDIFVHEGTRYIRGRPYLRNAVTSVSAQIDSNFSKAVQDTLNEIGRET